LETRSTTPNSQEKNSTPVQSIFSAPTISLPKGGGAIRGIGEKFAANPVTGTGTTSIPLPTSPGRSGFDPQLSLAYDSGASNGIFGFGWSLLLPSVTRKTDQGLPRYQDQDPESDIFLLSGTEDLVPVLNHDSNRFRDTTSAPGYIIQRYRPRIEGLFTRIERWTSLANPADVHWRSISQDNILTLYGQDNNSRIFDSADARRIFSWLICEVRDDKGNGIVYTYKEEDGAGVDMGLACERNRGAPEDPCRAVNRYLKHIYYGNRLSLLDNTGKRPRFLTPAQRGGAEWMFEVVFDYGEHDANVPTPDDTGRWLPRQDPFSSYRSGFEIRTSRLCQRVLMFHHFPGEPGVGQNCLVRDTAFNYRQTPLVTFLNSVTQNGYKRDGAGYIKQSMPALEFEYSEAVIGETVEIVDPVSVENLPAGVDGSSYQWVDLDGEGLAGILSEQGGAWFYKRNESPLIWNRSNAYTARFAPIEQVAHWPLDGPLIRGGWHFQDLAGDGQIDLVHFDPPLSGFYERTDDQDWKPFRAFISIPNLDWKDQNLTFIDLTGDSHPDILITEDQAFTWYPSLAEEGFGTAERLMLATDEERGPSVLFVDNQQTIFQADLSGDGLTDIVRIRNGEVCYWPNLGYGRFGEKVTMDGAPWFDVPDQFNPSQIRLADIDGSGTTDIIYLGRDCTRFWFNQSGNNWSVVHELSDFPPVDNLANVAAVDLLGNGTACLVWSSPLPGSARSPLRYINLMANGKPHLLVSVRNNLGAETCVRYAPSTYFYLKDKYAGKPWATRLPFPVHVVEQVEVRDRVSQSRFVTHYTYHHGYFDGEEREFRGFGMVEQTDTEERSAQPGSELTPYASPIHIKTWFHTGVYLGRERVSRLFDDEYYREPGMTDDEFQASLLSDAILPDGLTREEEYEACRALKGLMLRQEVYADDAPPGSSEAAIKRALTPYTVEEHNYTIRPIQRRFGNQNAVFFTHPREAITYHYERRPSDPRIQHALTLEVDDYGGVLKDLAVGYGRRHPDLTLPTQADRDKQTQTLITYTESRFTNPIDDVAHYPHDYRTPKPCESRTSELTSYTPENGAARFCLDEWTRNNFALLDSATEIPYEQAAARVSKQKRPIEHIRILYRKDDLTALAPLGSLEPYALPGDSLKLAFTSGLLAQVFQRNGQPLLPNPPSVLGGQGGDQGGYLASQNLKAAGLFPNSDPNDHWWVPAGRMFYSPDVADTPTQELSQARDHFFMPRRYLSPFSQTTTVDYAYDLLPLETRDALGGRVTVGERLPDGSLDLTKPGNDYRVLHPQCIMDHNRNRSQVAFDALGLVIGTAMMGKPEETLGDSLNGFKADLTGAEVLDHLTNPLSDPGTILGRATTRLVYDPFVYQRTQNQPDPQPVVVYTLARETHDSELQAGQTSRIQHTFTYFDGFGREIQKKIQAEPGPVPQRDGATGKIIVDSNGQPQMTANDISPRWVGSGWTVFNNKGNPVLKFEPFFTDTQHFEFDVRIGISPVLFYDPVERVIATLHPNHTWEKVVFDPWQQASWDVNDTVLDDPRTDDDISGYTADYFVRWPLGPPALAWRTWFEMRQSGGLGTREQEAAEKASAHARTPSVVYFDTLGRPYLTESHNKVVCPDHDLDGMTMTDYSRVELDIEGNQRQVRDAVKQFRDGQGNLGTDELGRVIMHYAYDMLGNRVYQLSMEAGARWMLNDASGNPIRAWDSQNQTLRTTYDSLRRPLHVFVTGTDPANPKQEVMIERLVYGEQHPQAEQRNLLGVLWLHLDQAGGANTEAYDFKGNQLRSTRRLALEYRNLINWSAVDAVLPANATDLLDLNMLEAVLTPMMESERYTGLTDYDALNRPVRQTTPHTNTMQPSVIHLVYNEANLLEQVEVNLNGAKDNHNQLVWTPFIANIDYDAKGQRTRIDYVARDEKLISTSYEYDFETLRLVKLYTRRGVDPATGQGVTFTDDCTNPQPPPNTIASPEEPPKGKSCGLQNIHYTYDPVGNLTYIQDGAQQTIYFKNQQVDPSANFTYDALYQLIQATGREFLGGPPIPHSYNDAGRVGLLSSNGAGHFGPNDGNAVGRYCEKYVYDAAGNFLKMSHHRACPDVPSWTRTYVYEEASLIEPSKQSNRLTRTAVGSSPTGVETYSYDAHGCLTRMNHLSLMAWDYQDRLHATSQQVVNNGGTPETSYYVHNAAGERARKVTDRQAGPGQMPRRKEERIYLGGFEIYRTYAGNDSSLQIERETLHVSDGQHRFALVETRTEGSDPAPQQLIRYQFGNQLDSSTLEVDDQAEIISYEEYTPYGSTSYQAVRSKTETPKRYRFSGKERDEESGLDYFGARYYAAYLGRWISTEPGGLGDGFNLYEFVQGNPVTHVEQDGYGWRDFARGAVKGLVTGIIIGAVVATLPISGTAALVIGGVGVVATGYSAYKTHSDYKSGKITAEKADEQYGELGGGLVGGAIGGGGVNGLKGMVSGLPERELATEFATVGPRIAPPVFRPPPPVTGGAVVSPATGSVITATATPTIVMSTAIAKSGSGGGGSSGSKDTSKKPKEENKPSEKDKEPKTKDSVKKPSSNVKAARAANLRLPNEDVAAGLSKEGALTEMANKIKGLGDQAKGVTIEIVLARTKEGKEILVAGINSSNKGFNKAQLAQLKAWGVNVAPQIAKGTPKGPHAEQNIAAFLEKFGAVGVRWSKAIVGAIKPGGSSYVCKGCQDVIKRAGGRIEE
jgi:RHS repeat-associated protein